MICDVMVNMPSQFMISGNFTALAHCGEFRKPRAAVCSIFSKFFPDIKLFFEVSWKKIIVFKPVIYVAGSIHQGD